MAARVSSGYRKNTNLQCMICMQKFQDPRVLQCGHRFCLKCVEKSSALDLMDYVSCPECHFVTHLSGRCLADLPKESLPSKQPNNRSSYLDEHRERVKYCDLCKGLKNVATNRCGECKKNMCGQCEQTHHMLSSEQSCSGGRKTEEEVEAGAPSCPTHPTLDVAMYCLDCAFCVCSQCIMGLHKHHRFVYIKDKPSQERTQIQELNKYLDTFESDKHLSMDVESKIEDLKNMKRDISKSASIIKSQLRESKAEINRVKKNAKTRLSAEIKRLENLTYDMTPSNDGNSMASPTSVLSSPDAAAIVPLGKLKVELTIPVAQTICGLFIDQKEKRIVVRTRDTKGPIKLYNYDGELVFSIGRRLEQMAYPGGIAMDTRRDLYLAPSDDTLLLIDKSGNLKHEIDVSEESNLRGVAYSEGGDLYAVSDIGKHKVYLISADSHQVTTRIGSRGSGPYKFYGPYNVHCECLPGFNHVIVVSDCNNHCLKMFDLKGNHVHTYGRHGIRDGQLNYPWGVTSDGAGRIIVTDNQRVTSYWREQRLDQWRCLVAKEKLGNRPECVSVDPVRGLMAVCVDTTVLLFKSMA